jgi:phosphopantetheine adenylyltransferase
MNIDLAQLITPNVCTSGVWEDTWIWYCDECRVHGAEASAHVAEFMARSHMLTTAYMVDEDDEDGETLVTYLEEDEDIRDVFTWTYACEGCVYIISEKLGKTWELGEDYSQDKVVEPETLPNIEQMQEIRKQMGLP